MDENGLFSALSLVSVFIYLTIGIYTFQQNTKSSIHRIFMLLCSSYAIWSFAYSFAYLSWNKHIFSIWNKIAAIGWCSFSALSLYLVLLITENRLIKIKIVKIFIFLPAMLFLYMAIFLFGENINTSKIVSDFFYIGDFLYNFIFLLISIICLFVWGLKANSLRIKKQSNILVISSLVPFMLNLLTQTILPLMGNIEFPLMGQLYSVIMILGTYRVITKYKFLRLPEKFIFDEIVNEMMDMVIVLDEKGKIIRVSKHTLDLLNYEENELLNREINLITDGNNGEIISLSKMKESDKKYNDMTILKKNGEKIPVNISCKQIFDGRIHDFLGAILVIQDISLIKDLQKKNIELKAYVQQLTEAEEELRLQNTLKVESDKKLSISEEKFRTMYEQAPLGISLSDSLTGHIYEINSKFVEITGRTPEELINHDWMTITHPDDVNENLKNSNLLHDKKKSSFTMKKRYIRPNGTIVWVKIIAATLSLVDKGNPSEICMVEDITEQKLNEEALKASEYTFRKLFEGSSDPILLMEDNKIIDCNPATIELLRHDSKASIIGKNTWELSPENQPDGQSSQDKALEIIEHARKNGKYKFEWWHKKEDDVEFPIEIMLTSIVLNGKEVFHALWRDVSERKQLEQKLVYLSYHDVLTGLYNRRFFEEELMRLDVPRNFPLTIVMADVNGLKLINDSFGHATGDALLKKVGEVIKRGCRADDIIARLGGDEFVILLPRTDSYETEQIVNRIKTSALKENVDSVEISISFGWETKNYEEENIQEILKIAEDFMYKKKLFESPSMRGKTINAIINTLHEKNKREEQHSHRVSALCESMGKALGLHEGEIQELKTVSLLHDIGKIAIEETILNKPGKLTKEEWKDMRRHPEIGYRILKTVNDMSDMAEYVLTHHERWDGKGYPKGIKGEEIPLQSRIIAIADAYDAMTSERSYRSALPEEFAIEELQKNSGSHFDLELVKVFIERVLHKPWG